MQSDMNLVIFTLSSIFYCLCFAGNTGSVNKKDNTTDDTNCYLRVSALDMPLMPIPFTDTEQHSSIIYPNKSSQLVITSGSVLKFSCSVNTFKSMNNTNEVTVSCVSGNTLSYNGQQYTFDYFECNDIPKSTMIMTKEKCQDGKHTVFAVGFQTSSVFLTQYKTCFDLTTKKSLYTWYYNRWPYFNNQSITEKNTMVINKLPIYGNTNLRTLYSVTKQKEILTKILGSRTLASKYINNNNDQYLIEGQYASKADFFFAFEQCATNRYANMTPQWLVVRNNEWSKIEELNRKFMENKRSKFLIITGSYGLTTLKNSNDAQVPIFLEPPKKIPVPQFFWKLYYDLSKNDGMVFIGLNNPYKKITDEDVFILCPNVYDDYFNKNRNNKTKNTNTGMMYCCTKSSFEKSYGKLDPIIFKQF